MPIPNRVRKAQKKHGRPSDDEEEMSSYVDTMNMVSVGGKPVSSPKPRPRKMPEFWPLFRGRMAEEWDDLSKQEKKSDSLAIQELITVEDETGQRKPKGRLKMMQAWVDEDPEINNKFVWWQKTSGEQEEIRKRIEDSNRKKRGRPKGSKDVYQRSRKTNPLPKVKKFTPDGMIDTTDVGMTMHSVYDEEDHEPPMQMKAQPPRKVRFNELKKKRERIIRQIFEYNEKLELARGNNTEKPSTRLILISKDKRQESNPAGGRSGNKKRQRPLLEIFGPEKSISKKILLEARKCLSDNPPGDMMDRLDVGFYEDWTAYEPRFEEWKNRAKNLSHANNDVDHDGDVVGLHHEMDGVQTRIDDVDMGHVEADDSGDDAETIATNATNDNGLDDGDN